MSPATVARPRALRLRPVALACLSGLWLLPASAQTTAAAQPVERVEVVGATPLNGANLRRNQIAAPVQSASDEDLTRTASGDLSEFMNRRMGSVHVNSITGNPLQMDVNYRGYTASPLLGTPQGLSVYLDGMRLNQPFGDVVGWDLIPKSAIATMQLMPGSNPLFGLNTLGGALAIQSKDGRSHPGGAVEASIGSHGRLYGEVSYGTVLPSGIDVFGTTSQLLDDGWRVNSASDVMQGFFKAGYTYASGTRVALSVAAADSKLNGNGLQEQRFLARDYASVYTQPDITQQQSSLANLSLEHAFSATTRLSANLYARRVKGSTLNADINEGSLDQPLYQPGAQEQDALAAAGYSGFPTSGANAGNTPFPSWRCIANGLLIDAPGEKCNGLINTTATAQHTAGLNAQLSLTGDLNGQRNLLVVGGTLESSRVSFQQDAQLGYLNPDRTVTGIPSFADGVTGGNVDGEPLDNRVRLGSRSQTVSLFASDTLSFGPTLNANVSARYNRTTVHNRDGLVSAPDPSSLDGDHTYSRVNPALGLTWNPTADLGAYAGWASSSRAPTAIELGCANPDNPCKLPNAMAGDPPLRQVVTRTVELGLRGKALGTLNWRAGVFNASNVDDILFVADAQSGFGYFKNFGRTERKGFELGLDGHWDALSLGLNFTRLDATYQSAETVLGEANSANDTGGGLEGNIQIAPGNRIPLVPQHILKASLGYEFNPQWSLDADWQAVSSSLARGNENGQHAPDGIYYLGQGHSPGYAVVNLGVAYRPSEALKFFLQVNNAFDRRYSTAAQLGATGFDDNGNFQAQPFAAVDGAYPLRHATFYAPGAPRSFVLGLRYEFGK